MWLSSLPCSVRRRRPPPSGCRGRCAMATARDVEEVVQKLASDRVRPRDEGVKLLGTWLQGDRAVTFCRLLARNTVRAKPAQLASAHPAFDVAQKSASPTPNSLPIPIPILVAAAGCARRPVTSPSAALLYTAPFSKVSRASRPVDSACGCLYGGGD
ncbi:hypothetical protein ZWY2020_052159 [Hordeum vulgare]|nr:hypothetical protein ZWY2020_052159 [Hordeum vulgare]